MANNFLSLPTELKCLIVLELSSGSPDSLAALALTHTSYQREAEKALYRTLSIFALSDYSLKCMETLAMNPEKAALVRFLTIEYSRSWRSNIDNNRRVTTCLSKSLINMHTLSDFRIRWPDDEAQMNNLGKILCEGHFRLQILHCNDNLDISQIIKSQPELQILVLYTYDGQGKILKTLKELHNAQLFLPIVLTLQRDASKAYPEYIGIFPAFYSVDRCTTTTMHQVLAQCFGKFMPANVYCFAEVSVYLIDSSDMPSFSAFAKSMAGTFPCIGWLYLWFERRCEIPSQELKEEFSFFSSLRGVKTFVWPTA